MAQRIPRKTAHRPAGEEKVAQIRCTECVANHINPKLCGRKKALFIHRRQE
jgi:hypothetical protein